MKGLLELFDELCEAPASTRDARLAEIAREDAALATRLRAMLAADAAPDGWLARNVESQPTYDPPAAPSTDRRDTRFGPYRIVRELGSGGMGSVWLAERRLGDGVQRVALKFMQRQLDANLVRQFEAERNALARLEHPTIARLIDAGLTPEGEPYLATEYVDGVPLLVHVQSNALGLHPRLQLVETLCEAIDYAHRRLVVHRDIKPSNIMVDERGRPRLLDFGIAKSLQDGTPEQTQGNPLSPAYASPEQVAGEPVSTATDVFALGLLLFELLTGTLPGGRRGSSGSALMQRIREETIEAPSRALLQEAARQDAALRASTWSRRLRGDLDQIVLKALRREPERRYPSALALAEDLRRFRLGLTVSARPDSLGYRLRKLLSRHPWASAAVVVATLAMSTLTVWALHSSFRAQQASARALRAQDFLLSVFESADRTQTRGVALTAKEILASARSRLAAEFRDDPLQLAELTLALAQIHEHALDLGLTEALAGEALALAARLDDPAPQIEAGAKRLLASAAYSGGRFDDSLRLNGEAVASYAALGERFLTELGKAQIDQGVLLGAAEQRDAADAIQIQGLQNLERAQGRDSEAYADALATRGLQLQATGRNEEARQAYAEAVSTLSSRVGEVHPATTKARSFLAAVLDAMGRVEEARAEYERVMPAMRTLYDNRGAALAGAIFSEGLFLHGVGREDQAERNFREVIGMLEPSNFVHAHALRYLGQLLTGQGRHEEAIVALEQAVAGYRATFGEGNAQIWRAEADLGNALRAVGRRDEALRKHEIAVQKLEQILGPDAAELIGPLRGLATSLDQGGRSDAALPHLDRALSIATAALGATHALSCQLLVDRARPQLDDHHSGSAASTVLAGLRACSLALQDVPHEAALRDAVRSAVERLQAEDSAPVPP